MSRSMDTFMWILMAACVVLTIGIAIVAMGDLPADARFTALAGYALSAILFAYSAVCFLEALMFSSVREQTDADRIAVMKQAEFICAIGIACAVFAVTIMIVF